MKNKIIDLGNEIAKRDFMDFTDYDPETPLTTLAEAIAVIIESSFYDTYQGAELNSAELYDYLKEQLK